MKWTTLAGHDRPDRLSRPCPHPPRPTSPSSPAAHRHRRFMASLETPVINPSSYKLLVSCPSGLSRSQVSVEFGAAYDRIPHPDVGLEESIGEIWDKQIHQNPALYNGIKFRYAGHSSHNGHSLDVFLHLGLTDYRTFVGTNLNPCWDKFLIHSEDDFANCQHMSMPLGNGAIVETSDGKILIIQRSQNVGEFPGYFVFPGGHSEPMEIGISAHQSGKDLESLRESNEKVAQEMFDGIIREVVEEIGVPAASLTDPIFIGVSLRELNVRPTTFFFLTCNLDSERIQNLYSTAQDSYESTQLYAVGKEELEVMSSRMPGCHHGGFALYDLMLKLNM